MKFELFLLIFLIYFTFCKQNEFNQNILQLLKNHSTIFKNYDVGDTNKFSHLFSNLEINEFSNRLFLKNILHENEEIVAFDFLKYKALSRHDSGYYSTNLVLIAFKHKIRIYDVYNHLLIEKEFSFLDEINDLFVLHLQEGIYLFKFILEIFFYLVTNNFTKFRKFKLQIKKFDIFNNKTIINDNEVLKNFKSLEEISIDREKIIIRNFKDNLNSYEISTNYKKNLNKYKWEIEEVKNLTILENEIKIKNIISNVNKGIKTIFSFLSNSTVLITNEDLKLIKTFNHNSENNVKIYQNFLIFIENDSIIFATLENSKILLNCNINKFNLNYETKLQNFIFDSFSNLIFILTTTGNFLIISPHFFNKDQNSNYCNLLKQIDINKNNISNSDMQILRKDLVIKTENNLFTLDLTNFENNFNITENKINLGQINLDEYEDKYPELNKNETYAISNNKFAWTKHQSGFYILIRKSDSSLLFLEISNPSNKLKGNEEIGFNFKIPIIFVALIILFFYHYFKNKINDKSDLEKEKIEMLNKLRQFGGLKNQKSNNKNEISEDEDFNDDEDFNYDDDENYNNLEKKFKDLINKKQN